MAIMATLASSSAQEIVTAPVPEVMPASSSKVKRMKRITCQCYAKVGAKGRVKSRYQGNVLDQGKRANFTRT